MRHTPHIIRWELQGRKVIRVYFRFDDPSEISDHELEKRILDLFVKYESKICFAIIPFKKKWQDKSDTLWTLTEQTAHHMIQGAINGTIEIAQHGYAHVNNLKTKPGPPSEFTELDYDLQKGRILEGKKHLSALFSQPITGFVPPFNSYDSNTVKALTENSFEYLSAGWEHPHLDSKIQNISILPRTCNLQSLGGALKEAEKYKKLSPVIGVVLHHDEFEEHIHSNSPDNRKPFTNLKQLEQLLKNIKNSDTLETCHISEICRAQPNLANLIHFSNQKWMKNTHWRLRPFLPRYLLFTNSKRRIIAEILKQKLIY